MKPEINNKMTNEEITLKADELDDLAVSDEESRQAKGGLRSQDANGHGTHVAGTVGGSL